MRMLSVFRDEKTVIHQLASFFERNKRFFRVAVDYVSGTIQAEESYFPLRRKKISIKVNTAEPGITKVEVRIQMKASPAHAEEIEEIKLCNQLNPFL